MDEWSTAYQETLPKGYQVNFDDMVAKQHLPSVANYLDPKDPAELESIYYRIMERPNESCIEYIYYYNFQFFPAHSYDYEPIYVYLTNDNVQRVAFDLLHYVARVLSTNPPFTIWGLWHSFLAINKSPSRMDRPLIQLDDAILGQWYNRDPKAKFEVKQKLTDPWLLRDMSTFRDEQILPSTVQATINKQVMTLAVSDIDRFYQERPDFAKIMIPMKEITSETSRAFASVTDLSHEIFTQFQNAGYIEIKDGHANWTPTGNEVLNLLKFNLELK
jgi:hypothetical protein